jgi:hypothetical protein
VVTCTVGGYQCAPDVAVPLGMHCLEAKLGHYAVEEVANGDGDARPARTMTTATGRTAGAGAAAKMAVPHDLWKVWVWLD